MALLIDLYKKYTKNHISNILIIISVCLGYIFFAPSQGCPVDWDCNTYIKMVDSIAYDPSVLPHYTMRILPILVVRVFIDVLGLNIEQGFSLLSGLSYLIFSLGFYFVLNKITSAKAESKIFTLSFTLLTMASHHAMIQALVNVYQSTDALTYPFILFMFYFTYYKKQFHWVFILTLLGLITRQNLFFMGELCLIYGLVTHKKIINLVYIGIAILAYQFLVKYYHASGMLLASITPVKNFFTLEHLLLVIQDSGLLNLIIPILPITLFVIKDAIKFYFKNWYLLLYTAITVGQPFLSYHLTGTNFERIAMQGIWPLYLISGFLFYKKYLQSKKNTFISGILFLYACSLLFIMKFVPVIAEPIRLNLSISCGLLLLIITLFQKHKAKKMSPHYATDY